MDGISILAPVIAFPIILLAVIALSVLLSKLALKNPSQAAGTTKPYACGEEAETPVIQPDYAQFFPFAFFFTILHVVALISTTVPVGTAPTLFMAAVYIVCAIVGLSILYRR